MGVETTLSLRGLFFCLGEVCRLRKGLLEASRKRLREAPREASREARRKELQEARRRGLREASREGLQKKPRNELPEELRLLRRMSRERLREGLREVPRERLLEALQEGLWQGDMVRWLKLMLRLRFLGDGLFLRVSMVPLLVTRSAAATEAFEPSFITESIARPVDASSANR
jgi:hypothetical protein